MFRWFAESILLCAGAPVPARKGRTVKGGGNFYNLYTETVF